MWVIDQESGQDGGMLAKFFLLRFVGQEHLAILTKRAWSIKDLFWQQWQRLQQHICVKIMGNPKWAR